MQQIPVHRHTARAFAAFALAALTTALPFTPHAQAQDKPQKVVLRFAADFTPPPHPAGIAMKHFQDRLPQVIPGSEVRTYFAGALYTIPEAFEAMRQGNLEMTWMQIGKAAPVDPWMMTMVGPGIITTPGAADQLEKTKTFRMLTDRLEKRQAIKVFGIAHMSFGMGVGGKKRYLKPEDFGGRKVRSMGPVENAALEAWRANPIVMAFGEVPNALESGVVDGLMTSIGGWLSVREQAPFYTTGGAGAFTGDYYMVAASRRWFDRLTPATQKALTGLINETIQFQKEINWCVDKMTYEKYGTKDPNKPGVYWMNPKEVTAMTSAVGDSTIKYIKTKTPADAHKWVDTFAQEGRELSKQHPVGSSWIEKVDCSKHASKIVIK
ncbi:MAG TPA: TRAP transporter substrate-binding protein DctP [Burkholderiales bacterium]|nr:TRAP transporter substrate-binding protein DctP [Burkholderiales bacterium]